jgi:hypothetical protein
MGKGNCRGTRLTLRGISHRSHVKWVQLFNRYTHFAFHGNIAQLSELDQTILNRTLGDFSIWDQWAREWYMRFHLRGACQGAVTLAEQLRGRCPHCAAPIYAGPFTPDRARERRAELKARRRVLGLKN